MTVSLIFFSQSFLIHRCFTTEIHCIIKETTSVLTMSREPLKHGLDGPATSAQGGPEVLRQNPWQVLREAAARDVRRRLHQAATQGC